MIKKFLAAFTTQVFTYLFTNIFSKKHKSIAFYKYSISWLKWIANYFLYFTLWLITKVMFILSSISSSLEFWSVNHTSIYENSWLNAFKNIYFLGEISSNWPRDFLGIDSYKTLESCWQPLSTKLQWTNTTSVFSKLGTFSIFLSLVILFLLLARNFIFSGVKSLRWYPFFISNVILFSIWFQYILIERLSVFPPCFFLRYIQNNLEYLIQNMIHQIIKILHSLSELIF